MESPPSSSAPGLEDCLKLLKGERDEQRLAGLLLATKFCQSNDSESVLKVYNAVGTLFLERLLMTGMGKGMVGNKGGEDREAYLQLSVTVLSAFCRVPEIAASNDMVKKVPAVLEIISSGRSGLSFCDECYEFLFLVATASEDGLTTLYYSGALSVFAPHCSTLPNGCPTLELAMKILQLMLSKLPHDIIYVEYRSEMISMVVTVSRQFALLHTAMKFEALHLLSILLSSENADGLHDRLRSMSSDIWATYIGVGVVAVLQNRVASSEKLLALTLAESMMSILGESWLLQQMSLPSEDPIPVDRCLFLVLESSRVEVAVLLNDLAYIKYEASSNSSAAETIPLKQQNLAIAFSLLEKIIKLISNVCGVDGSPISESTSMKIISGLNETIDLVLDFLQDAKDHGQRKGDDLLASVRIVGSYLAEIPSACKEKVQELLEYILSIEAESEQSPFYSISFMLPMLCQATMETEGCRILTSFGGHNAVMECFVRLIGMNRPTVEDNSAIFLACDTILNILLRSEEVRVHINESNIIDLLQALTRWTEDDNDISTIMMASSLCSLVLDLTSEEALLNHPDSPSRMLNSISQLILRSLDTYGQGEMHDDGNAEQDLRKIVTAGYARWADRFPYIKQIVERSSCLWH
eukprot:TRINITY_DN3588_c0_g1_i9.p1 TRINITY_DN3588_c0_g1~~TRINITY_DN3588_c0_g1_i9.p1  ORF type:complete len:639 (+),score=109.43 TRINITY_DN3588_c0_g1_i9:169-2085(+)